MNSLEDPRIAAALDDLHRAAARDWIVFARALPGVMGRMLGGNSLMDAAKPYLKDAYIPIDREQGRALYQFARARGARHIVEFGASFGISTIYLAAAVRDNGGGTVITTEMEPGKIARARDNWTRAGVSQEIELRRRRACDPARYRAPHRRAVSRRLEGSLSARAAAARARAAFGCLCVLR
ncbi:MAG: O-methyltransferase [Gammaproteobacteria bacterium]